MDLINTLKLNILKHYQWKKETLKTQKKKKKVCDFGFWFTFPDQQCPKSGPWPSCGQSQASWSGTRPRWWPWTPSWTRSSRTGPRAATSPPPSLRSAPPSARSRSSGCNCGSLDNLTSLFLSLKSNLRILSRFYQLQSSAIGGFGLIMSLKREALTVKILRVVSYKYMPVLLRITVRDLQ